MFANLKPSPRVIFLDLFDPTFPQAYPGFTLDQFAAEVASRFAPPLTTTFVWYAAPVEATVEDLLIPLYEDPNSPLQPGDLVRAKWAEDKTIHGCLFSPKSLTDAYLAITPRPVLAAHLNAALCNLLVCGDPNLVVIVPDATRARIRETLAINDIPAEICVALHLRPDFIAAPLSEIACNTYAADIDPKSTSASAALDALLASDLISPPSV